MCFDFDIHSPNVNIVVWVNYLELTNYSQIIQWIMIIITFSTFEVKYILLVFIFSLFQNSHIYLKHVFDDYFSRFKLKICWESRILIWSILEYKAFNTQYLCLILIAARPNVLGTLIYYPWCLDLKCGLNNSVLRPIKVVLLWEVTHDCKGAIKFSGSNSGTRTCVTSMLSLQILISFKYIRYRYTLLTFV